MNKSTVATLASDGIAEKSPQGRGPGGVLKAKAEPAPAIRIDNVSKTYVTRRGDVHALRGISLNVAPGEIMVLLGPSGCGKTTLLRSVAGLEHPDAGEIEINERIVYSADKQITLPPERRDLSMVFQSYALWPHMTVLANVGYPLTTQKRKKAEVQARAEEALETVGLAHLARRYPGQLSGGQQQRVALARAIVGSRGVILFDEPLSNLDAKVRERLRHELLDLQQQIGFTALYVTHNQVEAAGLGDRVTVMEVGHVAQIGTPSEILSAPTSRYVADFVGAINQIEGTIAAADNNAARLDTEIGPVSGVFGAGPLAPGAEAVTMFRPEQCWVVDAAHAANAVPGRVEHSAHLGTYFEHRIAVGQQHLISRSMSGELLEHGAQVAVHIDPSGARIFASD